MILKMKFREIFLAKCLVVLFSCVKGSADKDPKVYGIQNSSVFLNIPDFKVEKQHEIIWLKNSIHLTKGKGSNVKYYKDRKKYEMFTNGTLKIDCLVEEDSGNYKVAVYSATGRLQVEKNLLLSIQEIVSKPEIKWICSQKLIKVICEVKQKNKPALYLLQNNRTLSVNGPIYTNGTWKIEYPPKARILTAKFQCEVKNDVSKRTDDQEIKCSGPQDIVLIGSIAGGSIVFIIFLALLIYCIRKKRAERYAQDDETPMQIQQVDDELKYRELSQSLVHAPQKQPCQQQRPPPQSQTQYQVVPPQPRPRTQLKSPRHMKKRP
ncbi:T-cell surface antigen CD2-like isoform X1 [Trachemys scripta elegans]|uniref:T-cell surface antigen CD2-like isoform X1 n=1 Tax=Trachemys scripta elegans TaxID=31138 RepID=UPI001554AE89|nr:T-cell surface antigen CD2-like isoform X1 [Trachemys scripta elegans]